METLEIQYTTFFRWNQIGFAFFSLRKDENEKFENYYMLKISWKICTKNPKNHDSWVSLLISYSVLRKYFYLVFLLETYLGHGLRVPVQQQLYTPGMSMWHGHYEYKNWDIENRRFELTRPIRSLQQE